MKSDLMHAADQQRRFIMDEQPDDNSCGPTCLHSIYRYYNDQISLDEVLGEVQMLPTGGTLAVMMGNHALSRGYSTTIYTYNLQLFDPTWFPASAEKLSDWLRQQLKKRWNDEKLRLATEAYLKFLSSGGSVQFVDLTPSLLRTFLEHQIPVLTGLSATYLHSSTREDHVTGDYDSIGGILLSSTELIRPMGSCWWQTRIAILPPAAITITLSASAEPSVQHYWVSLRTTQT